MKVYNDAANYFKVVAGNVERKYNRAEKFVDNEHKELYRKLYNDTILEPRLTFSMDDKRRLPYENIRVGRQSREFQEYSKFVHIGQRKLGMCEIQHLTEMLDSKDEYAIVIYAGSAPTNKGWMEHLLFPNVKFLLVDPNMFNIYISTYRDSHYYHYLKPGITYFGSSTTNFNPRYEVTSFGIRYFDGQTVQIIQDKYDDNSPNEDIIGDINKKSEWSKYVDYFYTSPDHIHINESYFGNGTAEFCKQLIDGRKDKYKDCKVIFWCDLRTNETTSDAPSDLDILWNHAMMYNWMKVMRPDKSMLKFRCPFGLSGLTAEQCLKHKEDFEIALVNGNDFVHHYTSTFDMKYFPGKIYVQCWEGRYSAETRLWVNKEDIDKLINYDHTAFEEVIYYYNCIERIGLKHKNPYLSRELGSDRCGDCAIEGHIWDRYKNKMDKSIDVFWWMNWLSEITTRPLTRGGHGLFL